CGDGAELGGVGRTRNLRYERKVVATEEELGEDRSLDVRGQAEDFHRSVRVRLRLPGYRRQLGEERANEPSLFRARTAWPPYRQQSLATHPRLRCSVEPPQLVKWPSMEAWTRARTATRRPAPL